ncbi:uncharacterized protein LOC112559237 isoform X2 [Pomacea canaliculata]|uniref:uncharacterized protein LOC112559237 isoform X2 n=1 Tax=Pomacea canaliculata TaxID=400727 RepID=UPI000D72AE14|nr:uncharacterized protein LOC112559237 isoform X2 [Pomacea canaliculata]
MTPVRCFLLFFLAGGVVAVPLSSPACCGPEQPLEQAIRQEYLQQLHEAKLEQQERQQEELQELVEGTEGLRQIADQMVLDLISRYMGQMLRPTQATAAPMQKCVTRSAVVNLAQRQTAGIVTFTVCGEGTNTKLQFRFFIPGETTTAADTTTTVETTTELLTTTTARPPQPPNSPPQLNTPPRLRQLLQLRVLAEQELQALPRRKKPPQPTMTPSFGSRPNGDESCRCL